MKCPDCKHTVVSLIHVKGDDWKCGNCIYNSSDHDRQFTVIETVNFKWYGKNGGNVPKKRIEMIKSRRICPDGNGEVVMTNKFGKITDRKAVNY